MKKLADDRDNIINKKENKNKMFDQIERCRLDLQKDPTNPAFHVRLGDLYMKWHLDIYNACQYIDEAITEYQLAMESLIDSCEIYYKIVLLKILCRLFHRLELVSSYRRYIVHMDASLVLARHLANIYASKNLLAS